VSSSQNEYKENRLLNQMQWYNHKARYNKLTFRRCQNCILIASVGILLTNVLSLGEISRIVISSLLGAAIAVIATITQLEKYYQNWIFYRRIALLLTKEKYFFENNVGVYDNLDDNLKNKILVQRIESICSGKNPEYFIIRLSNERIPLNQ
jgi:Protein of unknown function (DUF4231)